MVSLSNHASFDKLRTSGLALALTARPLGRAARVGTTLAMALVVLAGCAPARPEAIAAGGEVASPRAAPKRIMAAIGADPPVLNTKIQPGTVVTPGHEELERLLNVGLAAIDDTGTLRGQLADAAPAIETGMWKLFPDGRMETTWRIRPNAQWHDGAPFTSEDVLFTARVEQDREIPIRRDVIYDWIERFEAPDSITITVHWKRPYIQADRFLNSSAVQPRHLLEKVYLDDKAAFSQHPFWSQEFVGTGPFKLREYVRGSHVITQANDHYVLGRPKIDEIEIRFIPDVNTVIANVLAGTVDLTMGRGISIEQALLVRDQWREGKAEMAFRSWVVLYPQFINPTPAIVGNLQFRRALMHALDREQMAETIQAGVVPIAHAFLNPTEPDYRRIESSIARYDYDPARAVQLIEGLGYRRAPDGTLRDSENRRLSLEPWTTAETSIHLKAVLPVADYWQRIGILVQPQVLPQQRAQDREYRANFPSFLLWRQPNNLASLARYHSSTTPLPENSYVGTNNARYVNAEWDSIIDRFFTTIPQAERDQVLALAVRHMTENLNVMGLFYDTEPGLFAHRLVNVAPIKADGQNLSWNAHEWDLR
jgi:peptide/nickel transport system substrate-binding protein